MKNYNYNYIITQIRRTTILKLLIVSVTITTMQSQKQTPLSTPLSMKNVDIQIYDAEFKENENIYVDNLDIYYTKNKSPILHCRCNEENMTSIIYIDKAKFKAHITTKKHKMWLKSKSTKTESTKTESTKTESKDTTSPPKDTTTTSTTTPQPLPENIPEKTETQEPVTIPHTIDKPRFHAPRVSELRYFMTWTLRIHKVSQEIEERLPIIV